MVMPNFLIIGAPRSGTTSLHFYLKQHPQVFMSKMKELRFFAFEGKTLSFSGPCDAVVNQESITTLESYQAQFQKVTNEIAIGESSPIYLWWPTDVPDRIYHHLPDVKLIAIFRNPIDRAYSDFLNMRQLGWEPVPDFAKALREEENRIQQGWGPFYHYQKKGFYYANLERFFQKFDREKIRLYLYEDLRKDTANLVGDLFRFLGVDDTFMPDVEKVYNASNRIPKTFYGRVLNKLSKYDLLKPLHPAIERAKKQELASPPLALEIRKQLVETYREDILHFQDLINRDLSEWMKIEGS